MCYIYIIHTDLTESDKTDLNQLIKSDKFKLIFIQIDDAAIRNMPIGGNTISSSITLSTYYRILLPYILPDEVEKLFI